MKDHHYVEVGNGSQEQDRDAPPRVPADRRTGPPRFMARFLSRMLDRFLPCRLELRAYRVLSLENPAALKRKILQNLMATFINPHQHPQRVESGFYDGSGVRIED
jgi:hypothetical protein